MVYDAAAGLTWQKSGSFPRRIENVPVYIQALNDQKYAGYSDWRLPTLEEALSLLEPEQNEAGYFVNEKFDDTRGIWTADKQFASRAWYVSFLDGLCYYVGVDGIYGVVRAVR